MFLSFFMFNSGFNRTQLYIQSKLCPQLFLQYRFIQYLLLPASRCEVLPSYCKIYLSHSEFPILITTITVSKYMKEDLDDQPLYQEKVERIQFLISLEDECSNENPERNEDTIYSLIDSRKPWSSPNFSR